MTTPEQTLQEVQRMLAGASEQQLRRLLRDIGKTDDGGQKAA